MSDGYGSVTARYYDAAYATMARLGPDAAFYLKLAREVGAPVLELGCGTGRVLLPIAAEGIPCAGVDSSPAMLAALRAKCPPETLRLAQAPMQSFDLGSERFGLIFSAFRAFQHLHTVEDQLACLACVRRHLTPGGLFAFDVFNPRLDRTAQREEPEAVDLRFELDGDRVARYTSVRRDLANQLVHVHMRYERRRDDREVANEEVDFVMRYFFRYELEHLLARAGFGRITLYGDFGRSPLVADSPDLIFVAQDSSSSTSC